MRFALIGFVMAGLALQALAQDVPPEGSTVSGSIALGRSTFALPPGEWKVVSASTGNVAMVGGSMSTGAGSASTYLVQLHNGVFAASVSLRAPLASTRTSSWSDPACDRKDTLYRDTLSGNFKFPECVMINHLTQFWTIAPTNESDRKIYDWFNANGVKLPKTALLAMYIKYSSGDYVQSRVVINPEVLGQEPAVKAAWAENEWHPSVINNDPKRMAFVENLKKWSMVMADNGKATLADRKPLSAPLPSLEELRVK